MFALVIVLNKTEFLKRVLKALRDSGIRGATVIDSLGSGQLIGKESTGMPIIGGFIRSIDGDYKSNKTIFSLIEREEQVDSAMDRVERAVGGTFKPGFGIMFCVPVIKFRGGELERHIEKRERNRMIEEEMKSEYY